MPKYHRSNNNNLPIEIPISHVVCCAREVNLYIVHLLNYIKLLILNKTGSFLPTPDATGELSQPSGNSGRVRRNWSDSMLWLEE
ncbi:hypothetical protein IscW_ISCW014496 [Ixodes scapularis]|uniref:Uncharacterized protein n=1 Tax=Ixodes scapularis TaxID=6945 RepID=B7QHQ1_IXOSC|nr:hypothetical protein IscW_ISCW014496 [Ixodes scapularis]|eukprot:XP_002414708.1 hypothetical protein IscW_ISCW014496 [Ixodes scapularis]